jgi:hypothetical protein
LNDNTITAIIVLYVSAGAVTFLPSVDLHTNNCHLKLALHVSLATIPLPTFSTPEQRHALANFPFLNKGWVFNARDEITALFQVKLYVLPAVTVTNSGFAAQSVYVFRLILIVLTDGPF